MKNVVVLMLFLGLSGCGVQSRLQTQKALSVDANQKLSQQMAEQSTQPSLDSCREFTELEKELLNDSKVTTQDKARVIDTLLVTLRGTQCEARLQELNELFKSSPLIDLITTLTHQMKNPSSKSFGEIWAQNNAIVFDGTDIWNLVTEEITAKQIEGREEIQIKGVIKAEGKDLAVTSIIPKSAVKNVNAIKKEEVVLATREQAMFIENGEVKYSGIKTQVRATQVYGAIKKRSLETPSVETTPASSGSASAAASSSIPQAPSTLKFTFDYSDKERLDYCQANVITDKLLEQAGKNKNLNFEELLIFDLKIAETEEEHAKKKFKIISTNELMVKAELEQRMYEYSLRPVITQKVDQQGFWLFSKNGNLGRSYSLETFQKATDYSKGPILTFHLFERDFNMSNSEQVERVNEKGALSYKVKNLPAFNQKLRIKLDANSAYWLKIRIEPVAECMEKNKFSAMGASRDSIKAYIVFSVFDRLLAQKLSQAVQ